MVVMQIIHAGRAPALLIVCALSTTVSCGSVERNYRANERSADSGGGAGIAGKNSGSAGGSRPGGVGTGGASPGTVGSGGTSGPADAAGGSAPGTGDPSPGTGGS